MSLMWIVTYVAEKPKSGHRAEESCRVVVAESRLLAIRKFTAKHDGPLYSLRAEYVGDARAVIQ